MRLIKCPSCNVRDVNQRNHSDVVIYLFNLLQMCFSSNPKCKCASYLFLKVFSSFQHKQKGKCYLIRYGPHRKPKYKKYCVLFDRKLRAFVFGRVGLVGSKCVQTLLRRF